MRQESSRKTENKVRIQNLGEMVDWKLESRIPYECIGEKWQHYNCCMPTFKRHTPNLRQNLSRQINAIFDIRQYRSEDKLGQSLVKAHRYIRCAHHLAAKGETETAYMISELMCMTISNALNDDCRYSHSDLIHMLYDNEETATEMEKITRNLVALMDYFYELHNK